MDRNLEKYYTDYFSLFRNEGWKILLEELTNQIPTINSVEYTKDDNDLFFRKGQLNIIATLLNLQTTIEKAYEDLNDA